VAALCVRLVPVPGAETPTAGEAEVAIEGWAEVVGESPELGQGTGLSGSAAASGQAGVRDGVGSNAGGEPGPDAGPTPTDPGDGGSGVIVHVAGAVAQPGLVVLPPGARVDDAVQAAGGALPEADLAAVNLARPLGDGERLFIPLPDETPPALRDGSALVPEVGQREQAAPGALDAASGVALVDLNSADAAALETLPGIGPVLAQRVAAYRDAHGPFPDVEALSDVPGIGPATLEAVRELVVAQ
jgi:competence protein ComEA